MRKLELLAPARNADIGIAAIDCGADAVYIAGPAFGARQAAGNSICDIEKLCGYAHRFGVKVYITLNTILFDHELSDAAELIAQCKKSGADAIIIQDMAIPMMYADNVIPLKDRLPLHASTQCAIKTVEQAKFYESLGFERLILEREMSLTQIRAISDAVDCDIEFFIHGALCVCYSGQCYLSQNISGRSANRGACIQACRSKYDLTDKEGKILAKDKALLSLKDYNLKSRIESMADAGVMSFKIEGRLKNESYVKNIVREYSSALDAFISKRHGEYRRASWGQVIAGFNPNPAKTFNRGYTELFIDGKRGQWNSGNNTKSIGEYIGKVLSINAGKTKIELKTAKPGIIINNGDGFSFLSKKGEVIGFRADICNESSISCKAIPELYQGAELFRNSDTDFEKILDKNKCIREISTDVNITISTSQNTSRITASALTEDGRDVSETFETPLIIAENPDRARSMLDSGISKSTGNYRFKLNTVTCSNGTIPFLKSSFINNIRRTLAGILDSVLINKDSDFSVYDWNNTAGLSTIRHTFALAFPDKIVTYKANVANKLAHKLYTAAGATNISPAYEVKKDHNAELMRTRYCVRYELGLCPRHHGSKSGEDLFIKNNGRKFRLHFDCKNCEMTVLDTE